MSVDTKCQVRGCKLVQGAPQHLVCAKEGCDKKVHMMCYNGLILKSNKGDDLAALPDNKVACTKGCYQAIMRVSSDSNTQILQLFPEMESVLNALDK
jgi:hypothetical protein